MSILSRLFDERFLAHRETSTSIAGRTGAVLAILLFAWRFYVDGVWSWDLFAVAVTVAIVKVAVMLWLTLRD